jgi:hypothetical protein
MDRYSTRLTIKDMITMLEGFDEIEQMVINNTLVKDDNRTLSYRQTQRQMMRQSLNTLLRHLGLQYATVNDAAQALEKIDRYVTALTTAVVEAATTPALKDVVLVKSDKLRTLIDGEFLEPLQYRSYDSRSSDVIVEKVYTEVTAVMADPKSVAGVLTIMHASERVTGMAMRNIRGTYVNELRSAKLLGMIANSMLEEYRTRHPNWAQGWSAFARAQLQKTPVAVTDTAIED